MLTVLRMTPLRAYRNQVNKRILDLLHNQAWERQVHIDLWDEVNLVFRQISNAIQTRYSFLIQWELFLAMEP